MNELDARLQSVLYHLVDAYLETRSPVGSLALSKRLDVKLSPATVRYMMAELESLDLITSLHTSSGRLPTEKGVRLVMQNFFKEMPLNTADRNVLEESTKDLYKPVHSIFEDVTSTLSKLSCCAGITRTAGKQSVFEHIDFISLEAGRILVIFVMGDGHVQKHLLPPFDDICIEHIEQARCYVCVNLIGKTLENAKAFSHEKPWRRESHLTPLAKNLVESSLLFDEWEDDRSLIVKGKDILLKTWFVEGDVAMATALWHILDTKDDLFALFDITCASGDVQIFMGLPMHANNFAAVIAPYQNNTGVGAVGVLGPFAMDYRRIVPMVDYTACLLGRIIK